MTNFPVLLLTGKDFINQKFENTYGEGAIVENLWSFFIKQIIEKLHEYVGLYFFDSTTPLQPWSFDHFSEYCSIAVINKKLSLSKIIPR